MQETKAMFIKDGMPKGLILTSEDGKTFKRVGLFAFRRDRGPYVYRRAGKRERIIL